MIITKKWLKEVYACEDYVDWFTAHYRDGMHRDKVLRLLDAAGKYEYYSWLLEKTLKECPLPAGMTTLPVGLESLYLEGGSLPEGIDIPAICEIYN